MRIRFALIVLGLVFALPAAAQDIRWKPEAATVGDYVTIDQSINGRINHVYRGKIGKAYVIESYKGKKTSGPPAFTTYLDRDGNYLKFVAADGSTFKYLPHDCKRVLGVCKYTEVRPDGAREKLTHIAKAIDGGFAYQILDEAGNVIFDGKTMLDDRGNAGNGYVRGGEITQKYRLVKTFYQ